MLYALLTAALVAADQLVKFLVRANIPLGEAIPFIPHVLQLTYWRNTGAAFSLLNQHTWLLTIISALVSLLIVLVLVKRWIVHPFGRVCLAVVLAGAVGNLIDRLFLGFVTDMFQTVFMNFAIFNVADICVVVGGIAFCVYYVFFAEKLEKRGGNRPDDAPSSDR